MSTKITSRQVLNLIFVICLILSSCKHQVAQQNMIYSSRINDGAAVALREQYLQDPSKIQTLTANGKVKNILKFSFNPADIMDIFKRISCTPGTKDQVALEFGYDSTIPRWYMIAYAMTATTYPPIITKDSSNKYTIFLNCDDVGTNTRIDPTTANALQTSYATNKLIHTTNDGKLLGFSFNADQIHEILYTNSSGQTPDKVVIYFGLDSLPGAVNPNKYHVIAYGSATGVLLNFVCGSNSELTAGSPSIFDKADPCPPCTTP